MLNKTLAGFFAFFLGLFGVHHFYVGKWWKGVLQFAFFWMMVFAASQARGPGEEFFGMLVAISVLIPVITGIVWWATPTAKWQAKYDPEALGVQSNVPLALASGIPGDTKGLKAEGIRYYRSADYDLAIEAFLEAADVDLADPGTHFNLACSYAQLGQYPEAMRHLELSVTFGLPKPERIEKHPALATLRKTTAYG
ncbi:MAG: tetratricopeptide repeat protein, partial [Bacteroidota bacterium]